MLGFITKLILGNPQKNVDYVAKGLGAIGTMIDERKFTPEEKSKANAKLIDNALEFQKANSEQNSDRSKARRDWANKWLSFYLDKLIPVYVLVVAINIFYPRLQPLIVVLKDLLVLMGTGTLMVLGFFFGTHLVRTGIGIAKGK